MFKSVRDTVSYANLMATIAVFIALGGSAFALTSTSGGGILNACAKKKTGALRVLRTGKRCKKAERRITLIARSTPGAPGPAGQQGPQGAAGQPGSNGSAGLNGTAGATGATGATGTTGAAGTTGVTGTTGSAGATPAALTMLSENWASFGNPPWTNQPAALTELFGLTTGRTRADLTVSSQVRIEVNVAQAGTASAAIRMQYSTDQASWNYLDGGTGPSVTVNTTGLKVSPWVNLAAGAKADVYLRVVGINGDGVADPSFGDITLQVR